MKQVLISIAAMVLAASAQAEAPSAIVSLEGGLTQGGLVIGQAGEGAQIMLGDTPVDVGADGRFAIGFGRDHPETAVLTVTMPDGRREQRTLTIEPREYRIQRIDGLPPSKVNPRTEEEWAAIKRGQDLKNAAREIRYMGDEFAGEFVWPAKGIVSGVYGSQRILNGDPKRPHFGVDVAAPTGTPVAAPAGGTVILADDQMYFEGGLVMINHGHGVTSALMHLSRIDVEAGQSVEQGDVIGAIGSTGRSTGPHLHWGMSWAGRRLDPELLVPPMAPDGE